jgi:hypothetical protein
MTKSKKQNKLTNKDMEAGDRTDERLARQAALIAIDPTQPEHIDEEDVKLDAVTLEFKEPSTSSWDREVSPKEARAFAADLLQDGHTVGVALVKLCSESMAMAHAHPVEIKGRKRTGYVDMVRRIAEISNRAFKQVGVSTVPLAELMCYATHAEALCRGKLCEDRAHSGTENIAWKHTAELVCTHMQEMMLYGTGPIAVGYIVPKLRLVATSTMACSCYLAQWDPEMSAYLSKQAHLLVHGLGGAMRRRA